MKVGKFLMAFVFSLIFMIGNCFAMKFSRPVEMGLIPISDFVERFEDGDDTLYHVGRFGDGKDALYIHYRDGNGIRLQFNTEDYTENSANEVLKNPQEEAVDEENVFPATYLDYSDEYYYFGSENPKNTVALKIYPFVSSLRNIYKISSDGNITFYLIWEEFTSDPGGCYYLFGKLKNEKWIKFFDTDSVKEKHPLPGGAFLNGKFTVREDTITFTFEAWRKVANSEQMTRVKLGELRCKWNEKSQNFKFKQVKY